jgi:hypothetical protein
MKSTIAIFALCSLLVTACAESEEECSSGTDVTETMNTGGPTCTTNIASDAPDWIKNNFHCVTVQVCSSTYVFKTNDLPPYKTSYYSNSSPYHIAFDTQSGVRNQNPNRISSQSLTLTIPKTPTYVSSGLDTTAGIDAVGISTYGVVLFNNQAAPGNTFATEYLTMDAAEGHPQNTGKYHYHTDPVMLTTTGTELIGIMLDGYPIYGKKTEAGATPTLDATTNTRSCTTSHFPDGTYCYHVANGTGANGYIIGSYFRGKRGTSN